MRKWLYTQNEVMEIFNISRQTLWRWRETGRLKPIKGITKSVQYLAEDIEELQNNILEFNGRYKD